MGDPSPGLLVAFDATPLLGVRTGVGEFVAGALGAMEKMSGDITIRPYAVSLGGRAKLRAQVHGGTEAAGSLLPARALHRSWAWFGHPVVERWTGPLDVVHGTNYVVPPVRSAQRVVSIHDMAMFVKPEVCTKATLAVRGLLSSAVRQGAWVATPSQAVAEEVMELLGPEPSRVVVVPYGVPTLPTLPTLPPSAAFGPGGVDAGPANALRQTPPAALPRGPFVLALGRVEPRKGLENLVRAFGLLAPTHPDLTLVVAGPDGWGAEAFEEALRACPHRARIARLGHVDGATRAALLERAAVFAFPSLYEGFGFPPLEAMAAGTPVVATTAGALPEVLGDAALLVAPGDFRELAAGIELLLDDEVLREDMVTRGRTRVELYSWDRTAESLVKLYRDARESGS